MSEITNTHPHAIFVYGTPKTGHGNNGLIVQHGGKFVGPAITADKYLLNDAFPYVWEVSRRLSEKVHKAAEPYLGQVVGEVYLLTDEGLEACDRLEGHPDFYCRTNINVLLSQRPTARHMTAGIYFAQRGLENSNLQTPKDGRLEWGRDDRRRAADFQRRGKAR